MYEIRPNKNKQGKPAYVGGEKMKNKTKQYEKELIEAIVKYKWMRWAHIDWEALSFKRATAYNHKLDDLDSIKDAFKRNRSKAVNYMLNKWITSDNATLQIAAFKICADDEDRRRLEQNYIDHTSNGDKIQQTIIVASDAGKKTLEELDAAD